MGKGSRLPADWQPSDKDILSAQKLGLTPGQIAWVRDRFVDYFTSADASRPVKKDWPRAWRNWVERDAPFAKRTIRQEVNSKTIEFSGTNSTLWRARVEGWIKRKVWPAMAGPAPDDIGTYVPREILREFGLEKKGAGPLVAAPAPNA